jgi:hypothetical protein
VRTLRLVICAALIAPGCTSTQAPIARRAGMIASIGGVVGLTASAAATAWVDAEPAVAGFSLVSAIGIALYAVGELTDPTFGVRTESTADKHHRWARILTERAFRYAREGNCPRVRRVEKRVNFYDRELHDFVFMRDEAIAKCMTALSVPTEAPPFEPLVPPAVDEPPPAPEPPPTIGAPPTIGPP